MTYLILAVLVAGAAFSAGCLVASLLAWLAWPILSRGLAQALPAARARALLLFRLVPVCGGAVSTLLLFPLFVAREPRTTTEHSGVILAALSGLAAAMLLAGVVRGLQDVRRARAWREAIRGRCMHVRLGGAQLSALCIDDPTPMLALVGGLRPELVVSDRFLAEVTAEELEVMLSHEIAHRERHDNLVAALLHALRDPLAFSGRGRQIVLAWRAAAEEAADDDAAGDSERSRLTLAAGLVRLACAAHDSTPRFAASSLLSRSTLERRVRRLVGARQPGSRSSSLLSRLPLVFAVAVVCLGARAEWLRDALHGLVELAVRTLP